MPRTTSAVLLDAPRPARGRNAAPRTWFRDLGPAIPRLDDNAAFHADAGRRRGHVTVVIAATILALALRLAAATGDLGLDEAWSLRLVAPLRNLGGVFWGLSHDNNHLLNSAWLFLLGGHRATMLYRLPAVVLGTLTIPAVARWLGRTDRAAGAVGAVLAAVALPLVDFGSEARGYAGLALASVLALDEAARAADDALQPQAVQGASWARWRLGLAVGFGLLSHLAMVDTIGVVGLVTLLRLAAATKRIRMTLRVATHLFIPSALLALPAVAALAAGIAVRGGFHIGDVVPFSVATLAEGFGGMLLLVSGVPDVVPGAAGIVLAAALIGLTARRGLLAPGTLALAGAALVVFPLAVAAARLPNVGYARYFAVSGLALLAVEAEALGRLWAGGGDGRREATLGVLVLVLGSLMLDVSAIRDGRGGFGATLALMRAEGAPTYATDRPVMTGLLFDAAAAQDGVPAPEAVTADGVCRAAPDWYVAVGVYDPRPDGTAAAGTAACPTTYEVRKAFAASPLSGTQWTLYRRR